MCHSSCYRTWYFSVFWSWHISWRPVWSSSSEIRPTGHLCIICITETSRLTWAYKSLWLCKIPCVLIPKMRYRIVQGASDWYRSESLKKLKLQGPRTLSPVCNGGPPVVSARLWFNLKFPLSLRLLLGVLTKMSSEKFSCVLYSIWPISLLSFLPSVLLTCQHPAHTYWALCQCRQKAETEDTLKDFSAYILFICTINVSVFTCFKQPYSDMKKYAFCLISEFLGQTFSKPCHFLLRSGLAQENSFWGSGNQEIYFSLVYNATGAIF